MNGFNISVVSAAVPRWLALSLMAAAVQLAYAAEGDKSLGKVEVTSSRESQLGAADAANEGEADQEKIASRVVFRTGEMLEIIPGLIVSQHSGEGKANQFYLRGMNLDHGTDLRITLDGMLINQRSHAHGQGWSDLNFLIPELVQEVRYKKGPYYLSEGDFASAGAANIIYAKDLERGLLSVGLGQNGYARTLLANSTDYADGKLLYALDVSRYDGPWDQPDNYRKLNGMLRYSAGSTANGWSVSAMSYSGKWQATDQIPQNAVKTGLVSRYGSLDNSDGGMARRSSLSGEWRQSANGQSTSVNAYVIQNYLDLFSNFTYFLNNPAPVGDQFNQHDERVTAGLNISHSWDVKGLGKEAINTVGLQLQNDNIHNGLYQTTKRVRWDTARADHVVQSSAGMFFENHVHWNDKFRTVAGARADMFRFNVNSQTQAANSGTVNDAIVSPKLALVFGPWQQTEYYVNAGTGFHSNDARGTTMQTDPATGLVRSKGNELGVRSELIPGLQSTFAVFQLDMASELLFVGDAGTTVASRPSRRIGWEFNNYYKATRWLTIDADLAMTRARFRDASSDGAYIPGAVEGVASLAAIFDDGGSSYGSLQLRYFGPRPLIEDNSVRSDPTMTINGRIGTRIDKNTRIELMAFNLTNRHDPAIQYYYESRPVSRGAASSDIHFHPMEPRSFRMALITRF
jgi:hypothetical protein